MSFLLTPDGVRLRLAVRGTGNSTHTFVLVHGWKQSHRLWDPVLTRLAGRHRVIAFDLRGMGESDKPESSYDFDEHARDLGHVLDSLDLHHVTLVGWSMGGSVALQYLDRTTARVDRLALVNSPISLVQREGFPHGLSPSQLEDYLDDMLRRWPLSEREFLSDSLLEAHPDHVDWLVRVALQTPLDIALRVVRHQALLDHRPVVARLPLPLLAMYSQHDPYYPVSLADWIVDTAPRAERVIFGDSAHCAPVEEPDGFCSALESFAASTPQPEPPPGGSV